MREAIRFIESDGTSRVLVWKPGEASLNIPDGYTPYDHQWETMLYELSNLRAENERLARWYIKFKSTIIGRILNKCQKLPVYR